MLPWATITNLLRPNTPYRKERITYFYRFNREPTAEECHKLAVQYFEEHKKMTLPEEALIVDVRPAFRRPLANVTPELHAAPE